MFACKKIMEEIVGEAIRKGEIAGANVLLTRHGRELCGFSLGYADREAGIPMERDTIFRMFSMTKPITAAAVLILAERGKLDLWDNLSRYIPAFAHMQVMGADGSLKEAEREIRIMDLLTMTSGIPYGDMDCEPARRMGALMAELEEEKKMGRPADTLEYCRRMAEVPLCFEPGQQWRYGFSADILGGVVETASGTRYGKFLEKEIFAPLGMRDTGFTVPREKRNRFAVNYEWKEESGRLEPFLGSTLGLDNYEEGLRFESGGAGLVSTIEDYSRFAHMLLQGGSLNGTRILGRRTVEFMRSNHLSPAQRASCDWDSMKGHGYGCLVRVLENPGEWGSNADRGEFGWDGWTGNYITMSPTEDMALLYFIQRCGAGTTAEARKLRMTAYAAME